MQNKNNPGTADAMRKLNENKNAINSLAGTAEGRAAQSFAQKNEGALNRAMQQGDTQELGRLLSSFLSTREGAALASKLKDIIK